MMISDPNIWPRPTSRFGVVNCGANDKHECVNELNRRDNVCVNSTWSANDGFLGECYESFVGSIVKAVGSKAVKEPSSAP